MNGRHSWVVLAAVLFFFLILSACSSTGECAHWDADCHNQKAWEKRWQACITHEFLHKDQPLDIARFNCREVQ